jgi:hypothetical protein
VGIETADDAAVLEVFARHGFGAAAEIGEVCARQVQNTGMGLRMILLDLGVL